MMLARTFLFLLLAAGLASAAPLRFEASSLKYLYEVSLNLKNDKVSGVFVRSEYGVDKVKYRFTGRVVKSGDRESKIQVTFSPRDLKRKGRSGYPPTYEGAPWRLVETRKGARLYVSVISPVRSSSSPSWRVSELEFDQDDQR